MTTIEINEPGLEFLKELQHELNTQTTDGNAEPVFWGIMETKKQPVPEDYGGTPYIRFDDGLYSLEEAIEVIQDTLDFDENDYMEEKEKWKNIDKTDIDEVHRFMTEVMKFDNIYDIIYIENQNVLSTYTGAFITKRAAKEYIEHYGYNHNNPHTFAMTAIRNPEFEELINIIKNLKFQEQ